MEADLVLWVMDGTLPSPVPPPPEMARPGAPPVWVLVNKMDLAGERPGKDRTTWSGGVSPSSASSSVQDWAAGSTCRISARTGAGFDDLITGVSAFARQFFSMGGDPAIVTRERHRSALTECADALRRAVHEGTGQAREDIIAEELRLAARALGRLVGKVDVEHVLDVIFRDFCIGK
jgi:tRNA modification GTPase